MITVTIQAQPGPEECAECGGTGDCPFDRGPFDPEEHGTLLEYSGCPWCRGTGRTLIPIPLADLRHRLRGA